MSFDIRSTRLNICSVLLGILTEALEQLSYSLISLGVNLAAIIISAVLFPIYLTAGVAIEVAKWNRRPNILAVKHIGAVYPCVV